MPRSTKKLESRNLTLADLAARLGLDKSSVSLALRDSPKIGVKTRARVVAAARQWGYRPNLAARHLATRNSQAVALVLPASFAPLRFGAAAATVQSLAQQAAAAGILFSVFSSDDMMKVAQGKVLLPMQPDGVLVWGDVPAHIAAIIRTAVRSLAIVDPHAPSYAGYPGTTIGVDNAGGARHMAEHLMTRGAKNLLFVLGDRDHLGQQQRWEGTRDAWLKQYALDTLLFCHKEELTDQLLASFVQRPDAAIFCSNDMGALEAWHRLQRLGVCVPEQVLLAGFDAEVSSSMIGLTSAVFDGEALGRTAFEVLMQRLNDDTLSDEHILIPVDIRMGCTTQREPSSPVSGARRRSKN
jgi:DNA-binding LacI/PurR family transcriptional regulator